MNGELPRKGKKSRKPLDLKPTPTCIIHSVSSLSQEGREQRSRKIVYDGRENEYEGGMMMKYIDQCFDEERALYGISDAQVIHCRFAGEKDGESALKETSDLMVADCEFDLRYPFWHTKRATIKNCTMSENCRAALWYDEDITIEHCVMNGIKALRECHGNIHLVDCDIQSGEFSWRCSDMHISNCRLKGEYPFFECKDMEMDHFHLDGKYSFQYTKGLRIKHADLNTKDAFWHSENVIVEDSVIRGEYLGWYSKHLKLVRCHIIGTQPLCYCEGLILEDCTMEGCDLSFENSEVTATIQGTIESVKNPISGSINAAHIGELIMEEHRIDPSKTIISCLSKG